MTCQNTNIRAFTALATQHQHQKREKKIMKTILVILKSRIVPVEVSSLIALAGLRLSLTVRRNEIIKSIQDGNSHWQLMADDISADIIYLKKLFNHYSGKEKHTVGRVDISTAGRIK